MLSLGEVADELSRRLVALFLRDARGRRPVFGDQEKLQSDPHFRDHLLFYEYFHGDTGRGVGAIAPDRLDRPGGGAGAGQRLAGRRPPRSRRLLVSRT